MQLLIEETESTQAPEYIRKIDSLLPTGNVLVVDDEPLAVYSLNKQLTAQGFKVISSFNAANAWEKLLSQPQDYDVILLDRMMPGVDGISLLKQIKQNPILKHIPVIMITAWAQPDEFITAIERGAFGFIYKPIDTHLLMSLIRKALQTRENG